MTEVLRAIENAEAFFEYRGIDYKLPEASSICLTKALAHAFVAGPVPGARKGTLQLAFIGTDSSVIKDKNSIRDFTKTLASTENAYEIILLANDVHCKKANIKQGVFEAILGHPGCRISLVPIILLGVRVPFSASNPAVVEIVNPNDVPSQVMGTRHSLTWRKETDPAMIWLGAHRGDIILTKRSSSTVGRAPFFSLIISG